MGFIFIRDIDIKEDPFDPALIQVSQKIHDNKFKFSLIEYFVGKTKHVYVANGSM